MTAAGGFAPPGLGFVTGRPPRQSAPDSAFVVELAVRARGLMNRLAIATITGDVPAELTSDLADYARFSRAAAGALMLRGTAAERTACPEIEAVTDRYVADLDRLLHATTPKHRRRALPSLSAALETLDLVAQEIASPSHAPHAQSPH